MQYIADRTGINGGAIDVENLLYFVEELKSGRLTNKNSFSTYISDEIKMSLSV